MMTAIRPSVSSARITAKKIMVRARYQETATQVPTFGAVSTGIAAVVSPRQ